MSHLPAIAYEFRFVALVVACITGSCWRLYKAWARKVDATIRRAYAAAGVEYDDPLTHDEMTGVVDQWQAPLRPMPAPDAPQREFDLWVADALRVVRRDQEAAFERTADYIRSLPEARA